MVARQLFPLIIVLIYWPSMSWGQDSTHVEEIDPCQHEIIVLAQKEGLRHVPVKKIPVFVWQSVKCRKTQNGKQMLKALEKKQLDKDYERTKSFHGWTITCASTTALVVTMFYLEYIFRQK